jgi:hypothetical protein
VDEGETAAFRQNLTSTCNSNNGVNPTKAALAVAMATELGRLEPIADLTRSDGAVALSAAGLSRCMNGCANTEAILGLQSDEVREIIDQNAFNPTTFREELLASFDRQINWSLDLARNNPSALPEEHTLVRIGGPLSLGTGSCGPHYVFTATKPSGDPLTNAANLKNNLVFFGIYSGNDYLDFTVLSEIGSIALDPTDGDNAPPVTTSGSCPTYENDRVYDPDNTLLGTCCVTSVLNTAGTLQPIRRAPGYLGCKVDTA